MLDKIDKTHAVTAGIAATIAAVIGGGVAHFAAKPERQQIVVNQAGKQSPYSWGDLSQQEIDKLTLLLSRLPMKFDVAIFCADQYCDSLALDFDNAFESAHWDSGIERPIADTNTGISVAPDDDRAKSLAAAIETATDGRIKPGVINAAITDNNRIALVISRKPK